MNMGMERWGFLFSVVSSPIVYFLKRTRAVCPNINPIMLCSHVCVVNYAACYIFVSRNLLVYSKKYILVQRKHIHSGKLYPVEEIYSLRNIYSLKFKAICSLKETILLLRSRK